jgi:uncharacterized protein (TIGR03067 family)
MIPKRVFAFLAITLLLGADGPKKDNPGEDVKSFQGTWTLISIENNGEIVPPETLEGRKLIVKADDAVMMQGDDVYSRSKQKLDAAKSPKQIDVTQTEGQEKGKVTKGIYMLDVDNLTICYVYPGDGRPTDFKAGKNSGNILLKFRREKR